MEKGKKKKKGTASKHLHAVLASCRQPPGAHGDPWEREGGLQTLLRCAPHAKGSQSPQLAVLSTVPSTQGHTNLAAHTHTQHRLVCLHTPVPARGHSSSGLCPSFLHDFPIRQNNTQGVHLASLP